jgi:hypothetical protein
MLSIIHPNSSGGNRKIFWRWRKVQADIDCLPQPVQHQHVLIQRVIHGAAWEKNANKTGGAGQYRDKGGSALIW